MTELSRDAYIVYPYPDRLTRRKWVLDNSTNQTIYKGQPMVLDISVDTKYARGWLDAATTVELDIFLGIADEGGSFVSTVSETSQELEIVMSGIVGFRSTVWSTDGPGLGTTVYMSDNATLATVTAASGNVMIGKLMWVADGWVYVMINEDGYPHACVNAA